MGLEVFLNKSASKHKTLISIIRGKTVQFGFVHKLWHNLERREGSENLLQYTVLP